MLIQGRRIRVAVAGCGRISKNHFQAIEGLSQDLELVAVCDPQTERREEAVQRWKVKGYAKYRDLLEAKVADLIVLCTPSGVHAEQAILAAESGYHVVTEKPMATRWSEGKRMVEAFDLAERRLFVVKQNRLNPTLQALRQAILRKRFGRIFLVTCNVFWTRPQSYYDQAAWRGTWELDGGAFMNQASHYVDALDWLAGPVESVHAYTATLARNIQVEDTGVASLHFRNGALGSINVTMLTHPKNLEGSITILGENGTVRIGGVALNKVEHWEFASDDPLDREVRSSNYETDSVYGHGHARYYENVVSAFRGTIEPETDGREGLKSLELLIAMYLSARDGKRVGLPLDLR